MAEAMSTTHVPDESFLKAYGTWADGGWGMVMTGMNQECITTNFKSPNTNSDNRKHSSVFQIPRRPQRRS